jgi:hypothetical protein
MSSLYDEAIADAKELVRMAEENATNKLIEAVAPRIRKIVEKRLIQEASVEEDDDLSSIVANLDDDSDEEAEVPDAGELGGDTDEEGYEEEEEDYDFDDEDDDSSMDFSGSNMASLPLKGVKKINIEFEGEKVLTDEGVELSNESINTLLGIIDGRGGLKDRIREARMELKLLGRALNALNEGRTSKTAALRIVESFNNVLKKSLGFQAELNTLSKGRLRESSSREMNLLLKEIKQMSTRSLLRTLLEREERRARLHEADDDAADMGGDEGGDEAADEGGEDEAGGDVDVDAVKSALESLASAVGMTLQAPDEGGDEGGDEAADDELDMEEGSVYELDNEGDMGEAYMEVDEMQHESRRRAAARGNTVYSIDESMLRRELRRLRRLREEVEPTSAFGGDPAEEFSAYDDVELNANVKESDAPKKKEAKKVAEAEKKAEEATDRADEAEAEKEEAKDKAMKEARKNRALMGRLKEAAAAINGLRRELDEQKLFNAKLLYVNKLMQNTALPQSKLKAVVEALDSAKNIREANLLYKSLNESLSRTTSSLSEGANRTVGSSSRSTRPGGMINESVGETDRWAVLAGIGNDRA